MDVYLTGVNIKKSPRKKSSTKSNKLIKSPKPKIIQVNKPKIKEETNVVNEGEISSDQVHVSFITSKEGSNKTNQVISSRDMNNVIETNKINSKNNFISIEDKKKSNKKFLSKRDFNQIHDIDSLRKKREQLMSKELKDEYVEYIMLKEPKYADFDKISEEYQRRLYLNYQKYNNNLLIIKRKKKEVKLIVSLIEKSLVNNYFLKDSSMLPVYERLIEKVKLDILTKKQEHDGYHNLYEELYNKNYTIKRKVLDEIDIDTINNNFYDQYKILKNHAIVQVSKKQDVLNQIEEYQKKLNEAHDKELKQKNKILKDLRLHIEVFKEDEKDLLNKLTKIKNKREEITELIQQKIERNHTIHNSLRYLLVRYHKSFISMNKIFRSVNAKNLEDVLIDVGYINHKFIQLKKRTVEINQSISELNSEYVKLCMRLTKIKEEIDIEEEKNKTSYSREDKNRVVEIRKEMKKINDDKYKINEIIQKEKGTFQKGITFLFQKIKIVVKTIKPLRKVISKKLTFMIKKYKHIPFSVDYNNINKDFLKNFAFIFFNYGNIMFYLYLNSMSSGLNTTNLTENYELKSLYNRDTLKKYEIGVQKSLETYNRRIKLKKEKQNEISSQARKKELERKMKKEKEEYSVTTQNKLFKRFLNYLNSKNIPQKKEKDRHNKDYLSSKESSKNSTSLFFTGIDLAKPSKYNEKESSKNNSLNSTKNKFRIIKKEYDYKDNRAISFKEKKEYLINNMNKFKNIFNKYQNVLIQENERNLLFKKKFGKQLPRSQSQPRIMRKINFPLSNKIKQEKEINSQKTLTKPILMDDDYTYDEDENDQKKTRSVPLKKNKTFSNFIFFKLNKDRANIYKKMNDLRKLQMAYFGGRFLNTHNIDNEPNKEGMNIFDEFMGNYLQRQNKENEYNKVKKRRANFGKNLVETISANKKFYDKTNYFVKKRNNILKNSFKTNDTYERRKNNNNNNNKRINYSAMNIKGKYNLVKNERSFNRYKKVAQKNHYSKSLGDEIGSYNYRNKRIKGKSQNYK